MEILTTNNLSKSYKKHRVVNNVNIHVEEGDIYGFVGENGAGKTTIIRLVTGLANPTSGTYSLFGVDYKNKKICDQRAKIGGIVESVSLITSLNALENLKFQCLTAGVDKSNEELIELLNKVGLDYETIKDKKVGNFSLGMRQRLGIANTLISSPKFILLDEPMNGLDPQGFIDVRETILRLHEDGITFLISSHILSELEKICNKVGFISHGKLIEETTMEAIHEKSREKVEIKFKSLTEASNFNDLLKAKSDFKSFDVVDNTVYIYDADSINKIIRFIADNNVEIDSINVPQDTIEDYYINVMGRGNI